MIRIFLLFIVCCHSAYAGYCRIPVAFTASDIPYAKIEIQGSFYPIEIDLGSGYDLSLRGDILKQLDKVPRRKIEFIDVNGNMNKVRSYFISDIKLCNRFFDDVVVGEETLKAMQGCMLSGVKDIYETAGIMGRPLLTQNNLLLDFSRSAMYLSESIDDLKKIGYSLEKMTQVSFDDSEGQIVLRIQTDIGEKKLWLDTGSTLTLLKPEQISKRYCKKDEDGFFHFKTDNFIIGDRDFGDRDIYLYNIQCIGDCDGILGMDFLKEHAVYLDFSTHIAYLS